MRNIFKKRVTADNSEDLMSMEPRGVHHTVSFRGEFNETWRHIREEIRSKTLPDPSELMVESRDIYSYNAAEPAPKRDIKNSVSPTVQIRQQYCYVVQLTGGLLESSANKPKSQEEYVPEVKERLSVEISESKQEALLLKVLPMADHKTVQYTSKVNEEVVDGRSTVKFHYAVDGFESTLDPFFGAVSTSIYYDKKRTTPRPGEGEESQAANEASVETTLISYINECLVKDEDEGKFKKEGFAKKPAKRMVNKKMQRRAAADRLAQKRMQPRVAKDRSREPFIYPAAS